MCKWGPSQESLGGVNRVSGEVSVRASQGRRGGEQGLYGSDGEGTGDGTGRQSVACVGGPRLGRACEELKLSNSHDRITAMFCALE